jgi:hypothetical protein
MKKALMLLILLLASCLMTAVASAEPTMKAFAISGVGLSSLPNEIDFADAVGTETMKNMESQYDLTGSSGNVSHYARLVVYKDTRDLGAVLSLIDMVDFKAELVTLMSNMGQKLVAKKLEENGAKLVEWYPASKVQIQKHNGVQLGAKVILSEKLPLPMFATVAVYPKDGKLTGIVLLCPDSDRLYWQPVFKQIINSATES